MAQFYASIQGNRGQATRMGTKESGLSGHIRGWDVGAKVYMDYNEKTKQDECTIVLSSGSGGYGQDKTLGTFSAKDLQ